MKAGVLIWQGQISIHALRVEGDYTCPLLMCNHAISIHALRVEGDFLLISNVLVALPFLSTPSGWRATISFADRLGKIDISIHALRVEGDVNPPEWGHASGISIHALRVEGDLRKRLFVTSLVRFLSTPSGWRATLRITNNSGALRISIHALRVEGDTTSLLKYVVLPAISIHALRVEGDLVASLHRAAAKISIHALRVEGDSIAPYTGWLYYQYFYPRPPGGGRLVPPVFVSIKLLSFLSTPSGWRATLCRLRFSLVHRHFYPRPPGGGRPVILRAISAPP